MTNIYAALEIGTTRTVLAVGESEAGGRVNVIACTTIPSTGVRKSQIVDINQVSQSIQSVLRASEKNQDEAGHHVTIGNAFLVISGQHIKADSFQTTAPVEGTKVTNDDINVVLERSRKMVVSRDRELLEFADQAYGLDDLEGIAEPKGMSGRVLSLNTIQIHADLNRINDAKTAADSAHLEIRETLFAMTCAAEAVMTEHERREGVLVLDMGGGCTGYAAYHNGYLVATDVIGVGGDHVTNDISTAFQTTQTQAEELKIEHAHALIGAGEGEARIKIPGSSPLMESRTISRRALETVVNARLRELLIIIRERLEERDLLHLLHAGIIITGGGAAMRGLDTLIQREFGLSVRVGTPIHVDGLNTKEHPESFAAVAGALLYAHRTCDEKSFFQSLFGGFLR